MTCYFALMMLCALVGSIAAIPKRCHVDEPCFPTVHELLALKASLDGDLVLPIDPDYRPIVIMHNVITTRFPIAVAAVLTTEDVQKSVRFAMKHNLRVTVMSSGHDYNGRSTAHESLMIYLGRMNNTKVDLASSRNEAGEITCESGNTWIKVYEEVTSYDRVIVGGSAHTVSMGGYTLGGGHSPMSRMFGMAVDNLLEVEMVTANGSVVHADAYSTTFINDDGTETKSNNTDIFWALRGGGGGTFGIVTKFTYRLHHAAPGVVMFSCQYPIIYADGTNIGYDVLAHIGSLIPDMPKEWGGYLLIIPASNEGGASFGQITLFLNHYGEFNTTSRAYMDKIANYRQEDQIICTYSNFSTFMEYEVNARDAPTYSTALLNVLMQKDSFSPDWVKLTIDHVMYDFPVPELQSYVIFTGILLGGKMHDAGTSDTAVHPGWRSSYMSLSGGVSWTISNMSIPWDKAEDEAKRLGDQELKFGYGMYPNESGPNVTDWKSNFWGSNYDKLLQIKKKWDPDEFFYCSQCVGSDGY